MRHPYCALSDDVKSISSLFWLTLFRMKYGPLKYGCRQGEWIKQCMNSLTMRFASYPFAWKAPPVAKTKKKKKKSLLEVVLLYLLSLLPLCHGFVFVAVFFLQCHTVTLFPIPFSEASQAAFRVIWGDDCLCQGEQKCNQRACCAPATCTFLFIYLLYMCVMWQTVGSSKASLSDRWHGLTLPLSVSNDSTLVAATSAFDKASNPCTAVNITSRAGLATWSFDEATTSAPVGGWERGRRGRKVPTDKLKLKCCKKAFAPTLCWDSSPQQYISFYFGAVAIQSQKKRAVLTQIILA